MVAFTLQSLVLRRLVRQGELAVSRLGVAADAMRNPGAPNPVLPPVRTGPDTSPLTSCVGYPTKGVSAGAGRPCRHAGASARQEFAKSAALLWRRLGGSAFAAAAIAGAVASRIVASVGEGNSRLAILAASSRQGHSR